MKKSKLYQAREKLIEKEKNYSFEKAISILKKMPKTKFDESLELSMKLGIDPRKSDQNIRGVITLPHGIGKKLKVAAIAKEDALASIDADFKGSDDLIEKIKGGWTGFDILVTSPFFMPKLRTLGKALGPKGLMPNPKAGTVSQNVKKAVELAKAGRAEFRSDKGGNMNVFFGKVSFEEKKLKENLNVLLKTIYKNKPPKCKKSLILSGYLSLSMSPSIKIDNKEFVEK